MLPPGRSVDQDWRVRVRVRVSDPHVLQSHQVWTTSKWALAHPVPIPARSGLGQSGRLVPRCLIGGGGEGATGARGLKDGDQKDSKKPHELINISTLMLDRGGGGPGGGGGGIDPLELRVWSEGMDPLQRPVPNTSLGVPMYLWSSLLCFILYQIQSCISTTLYKFYFNRECTSNSSAWNERALRERHAVGHVWEQTKLHIVITRKCFI